MQLFDRDRLAILILAGSCWLPTASAEKPAEGAGKGDSKGAPARLETFTAEQKGHWAYQPLKRPELPAVRKLSWVRNPIDRLSWPSACKVQRPRRLT
jgi:hypothetical protein